MAITPLEMKLLLVGADLASDLLMDIYFEMKGSGKESITADEILGMAQKWKSIKDAEIKKVQERIAASNA